ncbi:MAG TPA: creatininase [Candidatus Acidoferrum sp.]|nr:creatininase [Candidatus Acidoferrum sp.]
MTWQELKQAATEGYLLILPVGSTEQHGPHLPLSTDVIIPSEIAKAMASKMKAVVAPAIRYGYYSRPKSGGGENFPGTTSISASTLIQTIKEVMREFIRHGFRKFLLLNGHYENTAILPEGVETAIAESGKDVRVAIMTWGDVITSEHLTKIYAGKFPGWEIEHAAVMETSVMQYLRPDLVRSDKLPDESVKRIVNYEIIPAPPDTITTVGSLWSAREASKEKGRYIFDIVVDGLVKTVKKDLEI